MGELFDKRVKFTKYLPILIDYAFSQGYLVTVGKVATDWDDKHVHPNSNHKRGLAVDLNLFDIQANYLSRTSDHEFLGLFWEALDPECAWGGRFNDGNHYSIKFQGQR